VNCVKVNKTVKNRVFLYVMTFFVKFLHFGDDVPYPADKSTFTC